MKVTIKIFNAEISKICEMKYENVIRVLYDDYVRVIFKDDSKIIYPKNIVFCVIEVPESVTDPRD